jgi:hypothetical protein
LSNQYSGKGIAERWADDPFSLHQQKSPMIEMNAGQPGTSSNFHHAMTIDQHHTISLIDALLSPVKGGE